MSGFKGLVKEGWHPKGNDGGRESWRGDFKGINQVVRHPNIPYYNIYISESVECIANSV